MASYNNLSIGTKGDDVIKLQQSLVDAGYDIGSSGVDGVYNPATQAAARQYQKDNGLSVESTGSGAATSTTGTNTPAYSPAASNPNTDAAYKQAIASLLSAQREIPTYANSYEGKLQDLYNQIVNRDKFTYDVNSDALYRQYADQYVQLGRMAMMDTMGQAAALTGGYGSSYAQQVGQQTYDAYLQNLTDSIPQLYGQALNLYNSEGDKLTQQYGMLGDLAADEYGKYRDALDDWNYTQEWDYRQQQDALDREFQERQYANSLEQQQWERDFAEKQLAQQYQIAMMSRSGGSGGSSGGGYNEASYETAQDFITRMTTTAQSQGTTAAMNELINTKNTLAAQGETLNPTVEAIAQAQIRGVGMTEYYKKQAQALGLA